MMPSIAALAADPTTARAETLTRALAALYDEREMRKVRGQPLRRTWRTQRDAILAEIFFRASEEV